MLTDLRHIQGSAKLLLKACLTRDDGVGGAGRDVAAVDDADAVDAVSAGNSVLLVTV